MLRVCLGKCFIQPLRVFHIVWVPETLKKFIDFPRFFSVFKTNGLLNIPPFSCGISFEKTCVFFGSLIQEDSCTSQIERFFFFEGVLFHWKRQNSVESAGGVCVFSFNRQTLSVLVGGNRGTETKTRLPFFFRRFMVR